MTPLGAASAGTTCPACGAGTPAEARFCPACGERLLGGIDERRILTVLFADLVDSTSLVESLDPEAARDLLSETFRRLAAEVRRFGGTLEKYIGDAVFAVFGYPSAKRVLCRAAVVGRWFSRAALSAMARPGDGELDADLDRLADWLDGAPGEELSLPEVVASHLVQAVRLAGEVRAPTPEDRELVARAVAACQQAARRLRDQEALAAARLAGAAGDPAAAVGLLRRSLAALEATGHRLDRLHSLVDLAQALGRVGRDDEAGAAAKRALDQASTMGAHALAARLRRGGAPAGWSTGASGEGVGT